MINILYIIFIILFVSPIVIFYTLNNSTDWSTKEPLSLIDCFYFITTTISSVGYGDITPVSRRAKLFTMGLQLTTIFGIIEFSRELLTSKILSMNN